MTAKGKNKEIKAEALIEDMFKSGAHFGYSKSRRHPSIKSFIFGIKNQFDIIDLEKTYLLLEKAKEFARNMGEGGKILLLVGTKPEAKKIVEEKAKILGAPYTVNRWIGGTLTNFSEIKKQLDKLKELIEEKEKGKLEIYTKKEQLGINQKIDKLGRLFSGLTDLNGKPDALFVIDPKHEKIAVREAKKTKIPVIALANSDCDVSLIDYPVVANDASISSIEFFSQEIAAAYLEGKREKENPPKEE